VAIFKKLLTVAILVALIGVRLGTLPVRAQSQDTALSDLFPADTGIYAEVDTSNVPDIINTLGDLATRAQLPVPDGFITNTLNYYLTWVLGRDATLDGDVLPWLGDRVAVGVRVVQGSFSQTGNFNPKEVVAVARIKDDAAAQKTVEDLNARLSGAFTVSQIPVGGENGTLYKTRVSTAPVIVLWPGYAIIAANSTASDWFIKSLNAGTPKLSNSAAFARVMNNLRTNSWLRAYISGDFSRFGAKSTLSVNYPGLERLFEFARGINDASIGQGIDVRRDGDGSFFAIDTVQAVDAAKQAAAYSKLGLSLYAAKPFSTRLAGRIPSNALAVAINTDLAGTYKYVRDNLPRVVSIMSQASTALSSSVQVGAVFGTFETVLKSIFNLDMNNDVLSWTGGDYAAYITYNPDGDLAGDNIRLPFEPVVIFDVSNTGKASNFTQQINRGLPILNPLLKPVSTPPTARVTVPGSKVRVGYGLVGSTYIVTTGSGLDTASSAAQGNDNLLESPMWQLSFFELKTTDQPIFYLSVTQIIATIRDIMDRQGQIIDSNSDTILRALDIFQSAVIYGSTSTSGDTLTTLALVLR